LLTVHGGEPTLASKGSFDVISNYLRNTPHYSKDPKTTRIILNAQSNLLLFPNWFFDWVKEFEVNVATSIDGPEIIHVDTRRISKTRYQNLLHHSELVRDYWGRIGAVCVVGPLQLNRHEELIDFFASKKINVRFNIQNSDHGPAISYFSYFNFLHDATSYWFETARDNISIQPIRHLIDQLHGSEKLGCWQHSRCPEIYLAIDGDLTCWPCGRFAGHEEWRLGNLYTNSLRQIWEDIVPERFDALYNESDCCGGCKYKRLCGRGCLYQFNVDTKVQREDFCQAQYNYLDWFISYLNTEIAV